MSSKAKKKKKKIKYGKKDVLSEKTFEASNMKRRISIMVDLDVLDRFKEEASRRSLPYQTLINQALRSLTTSEAAFVPFDQEQKALTKKDLSALLSDPNSTVIKRLKQTLHLK